MFGASGCLPLATFQALMVDYDMPIIQSDLVEIKERNFLFEDKEGNELVKYLELFDFCQPKSKAVAIDINNLARFARLIQACYRGFRDR